MRKRAESCAGEEGFLLGAQAAVTRERAEKGRWVGVEADGF